MKPQMKTFISLLSIFLVFIILFTGFIYFSITEYTNKSFYKILEIKVATLTKSISERDSIQLTTFRKIRNEVFDDLPSRKEYIIEWNDDSDIEKLTLNYNLPKNFLKNIIKLGRETLISNDLCYLGITHTVLGKKFIIIVAAKNVLGTKQAFFLRKLLLLSILFFMMLSLIISYYYSKYIFKPIEIITDRVKEISSKNLHLRLQNHENNQELRGLINTFNEMLDRIETSFETQNNFISNASHELRTPLTAIIGEADVALSKLRTSQEYIETLNVILDEAEKLEAKTKALLFLAQTGFAGNTHKFEKVRIDQLLWDVKATIEKLNPKSQLVVDTTMLPENPVKLKVKGNEQLLHLALSNIINNACKYSGNKTVNISLSSNDDKVCILVRDSGIGIPEDEIKYIYDPFFRGTNTQNFEGFGVGLPLAQNIIRMHNGEINISSVLNTGTTVQIVLPLGNYQLD